MTTNNMRIQAMIQCCINEHFIQKKKTTYKTLDNLSIYFFHTQTQMLLSLETTLAAML